MLALFQIRTSVYMFYLQNFFSILRFVKISDGFQLHGVRSLVLVLVNSG